MRNFVVFGALVLLSCAPCACAFAQDGVEPVASLGDALARASQRNPLIEASRYSVEARQALIEQASAFPNPALAVTASQLGARDEGRSIVETEVTLGQLVELGGKRSARINVAQTEKDLEAIKAAIAVNEVLTAVKTGYARVQALTMQKRLLREQYASSQELVRAVQQRVNAGATLAAEVLKAETSVTNDSVALQKVETELAEARTELLALWSGELSELPADVAPIELSSLSLPPAVEQNNAVAAAELALVLAERNVKLEQARGVQDVTLQGGYQRLQEVRDDAIVVGFSVPLPVMDRNRGAIEGAKAAARAAELTLKNEKLRVATRGKSLRANFAAFQNEHREITGKLLPQAEKTRRELDAAYRVGRANLLDVIDSQRTLLDAKRRSIEVALLQFEAAAELENLSASGLLNSYHATTNAQPAEQK